jgi:hypothetical protein
VKGREAEGSGRGRTVRSDKEMKDREQTVHATLTGPDVEDRAFTAGTSIAVLLTKQQLRYSLSVPIP